MDIDPSAQAPRERVTARNLGDLAAAVPTIIGFRPDNSLVALCIDAHTHQAKLNIRIDLPNTTAEMTEAADVISTHINRHAPLKAILFAVTHDDAAGRDMIGLVENGIRPQSVIGAGRIHGDRYWDLQRPTPADGRPLPSGGYAQELAATNILDGRRVFNSRAEMESVFKPVGPAQQKQTGAALLVIVDEFNATRRDKGDPAALGALTDIAAAELDTIAEDPSQFSPAGAAWLVFASSIIPVRDALLSKITPDNARQHAEAWRLTATHAPETVAAGAYALTAFAHWRAGEGAQASVAVGQALRCNPDHTLAKLTDIAVSEGLNPAALDGLSRD